MGMAEETYEDGYRSGWESAAGEQPMPESMTYPPEGEARDYQAGFRYGRSEGLLHFKPGGDQPEPTGL
jgi:hypothetical protein